MPYGIAQDIACDCHWAHSNSCYAHLKLLIVVCIKILRKSKVKVNCKLKESRVKVKYKV